MTHPPYGAAPEQPNPSGPAAPSGPPTATPSWTSRPSAAADPDVTQVAPATRAWPAPSAPAAPPAAPPAQPAAWQAPQPPASTPQYAPAPQPYTPPQQYAPAPQPCTPPQQYAPAPQPYIPPQQYAPPVPSYIPPQQYAAGPQRYQPPQQHTATPLPFAPPQYAPPQYASPPQQPHAAPPYTPQYGQPQYGQPQPYAEPQYRQQPYGAQQYGYPYGPYPQVTQPVRKRGFGVWLLVLLALVVVISVAVPTITAMNAPKYANESYTPPDPDTNPPRVPTVSDEGEARQVINTNALYSESIPSPTKCVVTSIDLTTAPETELNDHMSAVIACLMRVWDTTVTHAGYSMPRPPLVIYSSPVTSGCGKLGTLNAAYCGTDQKIYYATDLPRAIPSELRSSRFVVEMIVAHEFGHAVQARTAILSAGHGLEEKASSSALSKEWSRRIELQADCFAGLFIHSVSASAGMTQQDLDNIAALMTSFGDDAITNGAASDGGHGLGASRKYWAQLGLASTSVGVCNTFAAPSEEVR